MCPSAAKMCELIVCVKEKCGMCVKIPSGLDVTAASNPEGIFRYESLLL